MEFAFVVLILGIVFSLAYPRLYARLAPDPLRASARRLAAAIRKLRNRAVAEGQVVRLRLQLPEGKWWVEGRDAEGRWRGLADSPVSDGALPRGLRLLKVRTGTRGDVVEGEVPLQFLPTGETERAFLYLRDERQGERTLQIHPFLNRVEIRRGRATPASP
ncbi:MAG: GspH/FimT family pseudopilin [Nitrospinota bacterium]